MKQIKEKVFIIFIILLGSCISQFIPETKESQEILVVEGLLTDQRGSGIIKLSSSLPLGTISNAIPVSGSIVTISDDQGTYFQLFETEPGTYVSQSYIRGVIGRFYTLHIKTNTPSFNKSFNYESLPMEMKPVPPIDNIYYEKVTIPDNNKYALPKEGCQIYLDTHDPSNQCKFYRWEYDETWEFRLPYTVPNNICWVSANSDKINVKSTTALAEARIVKYPLNFISNTTDRLKIKYSALVKQYSLNEDEYLYWEKLKSLSEQVGGLYDLIPSSVSGNLFCTYDPSLKVLGYFSVSAVSSSRIFIKDNFAGIVNPYNADACVADTIFDGGFIPNLNTTTWVIVDNFMPSYKVITYSKECADCTVRGTNQEPYFWRYGK